MINRRQFLNGAGSGLLLGLSASCVSPQDTAAGPEANTKPAPFPEIPSGRRLQMLEPPSGPVEMVLDTDTYNEVDDQFALAYAFLSPDRLTVKAVYAAPFHNDRSSGPADGMEKSYQEILRVLDRMGLSGQVPAFRGAERFLPSARDPAPSPATKHLIELALQPRSKPLYVVAIGCLSNVVSAMLLEPQIIENIVVVWDAAYPHTWRRPNKSFNMQQDVAAARVIFDSGVPLVYIPGYYVAEELRTTLPEIREHVRGQGPLGDYLHDIFERYRGDHFARSKVLWDLANIAYLIEPAWVPSEIIATPALGQDLRWEAPAETRHTMREAYDIDRDAIFADFFRKLQAAAR